MSKLLSISEDGAIKITWGALAFLIGVLVTTIFYVSGVAAKADEVPGIQAALISIDKRMVVMETLLGQINKNTKGE